MAEAVLIITNVPDGVGTAEADILAKYSWVSMVAGSKKFVPYGDMIILYAKGNTT